MWHIPCSTKGFNQTKIIKDEYTEKININVRNPDLQMANDPNVTELMQQQQKENMKMTNIQTPNLQTYLRELIAEAFDNMNLILTKTI